MSTDGTIVRSRKDGNGVDVIFPTPGHDEAQEIADLAPQFITQTNRHPETGELVTGEDANVPS